MLTMALLSIKSYLNGKGQISVPAPTPVSTKITIKKWNSSQGLIRDPQFQRLKEYTSVPVISLFTSEDFSLQKPDGSWQIIVDCHQLNPVDLPAPPSCCAWHGTFARADQNRLYSLAYGHWSAECIIFFSYLKAESEALCIVMGWTTTFIYGLLQVTRTLQPSDIFQRDLDCLGFL